MTVTLYIMEVCDVIVGKDSVSVRNGNFTIDAGGDGIKSTNVEETDKGYVLIENGAFQITSGNDGIQAETLLRVNDGEFEIVSGGGSDNAVMKQGMGGAPNTGRKEGFGGREVPGGEMPGGEMPDGERPGREMPNGEMPGGEMPNGEMPERERPEGNFEQQGEAGGPQENLETEVNGSRQSETTSAKGLKSYVELVVEGGEFEINSCDDAVHSNKNTTIDGGKFQILSGDDGIHADKDLDVKGGTIDIQQSYEGLEGFDITISGGDIKLVSSDDGINAAGDDDSAESAQAGGQMMSKEDQGASLTIGGGIIYVNAEGDGLDANGDIVISGGTIVVHGPSNGGNGTLDYANRCQITGGTFLGAGSIGMALSPSEDSTQPVITQSLEQAVEAGTEISVKDSMGTVIASITTEKRVQWLSVSTPELVKGQKYTVCLGEEEQEVLAE